MSGNAQKPEWKETWRDREQRISKERLSSTLESILPNAGRRIAYLTEPEKDLTGLLDFLQEEGVPMGSRNWALRARLLYQRLRGQNLAFQRALRSFDSEPASDVLARLQAELKHAREMACRLQPPMRCVCDWCGWDGARGIGNGAAACFDCLPEKPEGGPDAK